ILGWTSISHIRSDQRCVATLRQFGELTRGPILISYCPSLSGASRKFFVYMGFCRLFTAAEIYRLAEEAGLVVVYLNDESNLGIAVLERRPGGIDAAAA